MRAKEFDLLARRAAQPYRAVSRESLMSDVWDENWFGSTKTLDVHVTAVRRKLADAADGCETRVPAIVTLRGHGYRLETPATPQERSPSEAPPRTAKVGCCVGAEGSNLILAKLPQGPGVMIDGRRHPLRRSPISVIGRAT